MYLRYSTKIITTIICFLIVAGVQAKNITFADTVIQHGKIFTSNTEQPWVEAVAIRSGKYQFVGNNEDVKSFIGNNTQVIELNGKMVMPGINDAHMHLARGGVKNLYECNFPFSSTPKDIEKSVAKCIAESPEANWIIGGQWTSNFFERYDIKSPKAFLDRISGDKAVFLADDSNHNGWANSKALALGGITKQTKDPLDGKIVRNEKTGEPNGILLEGAKIEFYDGLPPPNKKQNRAGALKAIKMANRFGITGVKDAATKEPEIAAYQSLDKDNLLSVYMATTIRTPYGHREGLLDYKKIDRIRDTYRSKHVYTDFVKIFMDGVPTASRSAAMLDDYRLEEGKEKATSGMLHISPELLTKDVIELDRRGYTIKIHTAGDRSVRVALDAIESARKKNGPSGLRHELAHAGYIDKVDIPRFKKLNAVADLSPYIWYPSLIIDSITETVKETRAHQYFPIKSLVKAHAPLLAGSDWPAAVETMDPWLGIEAMVTRNNPKAEFKGALWKEEAVSLTEALKIYTQDGANALKLGNVTGSIKTGKSADLIVLNQNIFVIPPEKISETKVELTMFEGKVVNGSPSSFK